MKNHILKSILGGIVFSATVLIIGIAYAALPTATTGESLTAAKWNDVINMVNTLDTQSSLEAQRLPTAWVNFDGSSCTGGGGGNECTIRSQYNVTRIVRNSAGAYTAYFTTAMDNTSYTLIGGAYGEGDAVRQVALLNPRGTNALTTTVKVVHAYTTSANTGVYDYNEASFIIYGGVN